MTFSYTIVADTCEGVADCLTACPVECIHWAEGRINGKGTNYVYIDAAVCIDCGACLSVCPIPGAILDEWKPELQRPTAVAHSYGTFEPAWRTDAVVALARQVAVDPRADLCRALAAALEEAGCTDQKLLAYTRQERTPSGRRWVAELILGAAPAEAPPVRNCAGCFGCGASLGKAGADAQPCKGCGETFCWECLDRQARCSACWEANCAGCGILLTVADYVDEVPPQCPVCDAAFCEACASGRMCRQCDSCLAWYFDGCGDAVGACSWCEERGCPMCLGIDCRDADGLVCRQCREQEARMVARESWPIEKRLRRRKVPEPKRPWQDLAADPAQKVAAIKAYREEHGVELGEAKRVVEEFLRRASGGAEPDGAAGQPPR